MHGPWRKTARFQKHGVGIQHRPRGLCSLLCQETLLSSGGRRGGGSGPNAPLRNQCPLRSPAPQEKPDPQRGALPHPKAHPQEPCSCQELYSSREKPLLQGPRPQGSLPSNRASDSSSTPREEPAPKSCPIQSLALLEGAPPSQASSAHSRATPVQGVASPAHV